MPPIFIDISVPLHPRLPVWPGSHGIHILPLMRMADGAEANVTRLDIDIHSGTHIDAPLHFVADGKTTDEIPLEQLIGHCWVANLPSIATITAADLAAANIPTGTQRLLLKTDNSARWAQPDHEFYTDYTALSADAAEWIVAAGIRLVGIDYHSIQKFTDPPATHIILLRNEVIILEGLDLCHVLEGAYELICLPIKIWGTEGASARAILKPL